MGSVAGKFPGDLLARDERDTASLRSNIEPRMAVEHAQLAAEIISGGESGAITLAKRFHDLPRSPAAEDSAGQEFQTGT